VFGKFGRVEAPPPGKILIRDEFAARRNAIREQLAAYETAHQEIPEHLAQLADGLGTEMEPDCLLVDSSSKPKETVGDISTTGQEVQVAQEPAPEPEPAPVEPPAPPPAAPKESPRAAAHDPLDDTPESEPAKPEHAEHVHHKTPAPAKKAAPRRG
jgi:hypothetical protein